MDLGSNNTINKVTLFSRTDCCTTGTNDLYIMLFDSAPDTNATLKQNIETAKHVVKVNVVSDISEVKVPGISASHLLLRKENKGILSFAEVIVE